ncbi:MAG TPA: hypothetical protein VFU30_01315 [Gaiellaceae bacterium]|nr:hypothetical protein [Gaiellaceae bacterium]
MHQSWPNRIRTEMSAQQNLANREAEKYEADGDSEAGFRLRVVGRLNGIEDALVLLSTQIEESQRASR